MPLARFKIQIPLDTIQYFINADGELVIEQTLEITQDEYDALHGSADAQGDKQSDCLWELGDSRFDLLDEEGEPTNEELV